MSKTAQVITNDPNQERASLTISGPVKLFANIQPKRVRLGGQAGQELKATVRITPAKEYPFRITDAKAGSGENILYQLTEEPTSGGVTYLLAIENLKTEPGRYADTIFLKTDHALKPELKINVFGNITPAKKGS
jgi:hypothetical protein